jgi:hypothetical protein
MSVIYGVVPNLVKIKNVSKTKGENRYKKPQNHMPYIGKHIDIAFQITKIAVVIFYGTTV